MLDTHRDRFLWLELFLAGTFQGLPFTPNQYTSLAVAVALAGSFVLARQYYAAATSLFFVAFMLDLVDGAVARAKGLSSKKGAYVDTVADRYIEAFLLLGLLFVPLSSLFVPSSVWIFLILLGSMMTTYSKAAAKEKGLSEIELKGGLMSRAERVIMIFAILIALIVGQNLIAAYLLIALALLANITALQRIKKALD